MSGAGGITAVALAALVAGVASYLIVRFFGAGSRLLADAPGSGPQKFHIHPTPRLGGIPILLGLSAAAIVLSFTQSPIFNFVGITILCGLCALAGGLAEDFTQRVGVSIRLVLTFASAALGIVFLDAQITHLQIPILDSALKYGPFAFAFTLFAIGGFANAMNIVDGFNGLAGVVGVIFLGAIAIVAGVVNDTAIMWASLLVAGTLLGFLVFNYPKGLLFLGDGGAYFIGFLVAELAFLLVRRNGEVSPWFALTLLSYPIVETVFSIYRKRWLRQQSPGAPDGLHFHMLIHKRLVRRLPLYNSWANANTSPYLWIMAIMGALPAVVFWNRSLLLQAFTAAFIAFYLWLYWRIVRFRVPKPLVMRQWRAEPVEAEPATEAEEDTSGEVRAR